MTQEPGRGRLYRVVGDQDGRWRIQATPRWLTRILGRWTWWISWRWVTDHEVGGVQLSAVAKLYIPQPGEVQYHPTPWETDDEDAAVRITNILRQRVDKLDRRWKPL